MNKVLVSTLCGLTILMAAPAAPAQIVLDLGLGGPCGYPAVYPNCPYYGPPAGVYLGGGGP